MTNDKTGAWLHTQVTNYQTLPLIKTARGQAALGTVLYIVTFFPLRLYQGAPIANVVLTTAFTSVLTYLLYRGRSWAIVALLIYLPLQILLVYTFGEVVILLIMLLPLFYRALQIEIIRQKDARTFIPPNQAA